VINLVDCNTDIKVNALIKLGTIKMQHVGDKDNVNHSLKCFEEAVKLDADNPDIYLHRAQVIILNYNKLINLYFILFIN
jgi:cytochrome c-type biogenesis protein CcmH/NrfG